MKKFLSLFLAVTMLVLALNIGNSIAFAATYSGNCGESSQWSLNTSTGVLTISGSGEIYDSDWQNLYKNYIKKVVISNGITVIGAQSFWGCEKLTRVSIPATVYEIDSWAFCNTGLTEVSIPSSVKTIGYYAFSACNSLQKFIVTSSNNYFSSINGNLYSKNKTLLIQYAAGKPDTAFDIPNTVLEIGDNAFGYCSNLISISIPNSVTKIGDSAFEWCRDLYAIMIPESVEEIGYRSFYACDNLHEINVHLSNQYYSSEKGILFNKSKTKLIKFPAMNSMEKYTVPSTVTTIGDYAFIDAQWITQGSNYIVIPNTVKEIGYDAISNTTIYGHTGSAAEKYAAQEDSVEFVNQHIGKINVSKATLNKNGKKVVNCDICNKEITSTVYYPKTIKLSSTTYTYNGKAKTPSVTIKGSDGQAISTSNYIVKYASGRKNVGKYSVIITFKGNYSGSKTLYFTIKPKTSSVSSISSPKSGVIKINWKKVSNIDGYEIQVSKSSKFSKKTKKYTVQKSSTNKTVKFLKKTKSYVRIRTYKKVNGKKYYSSWSKAKSIKTK